MAGLSSTHPNVRRWLDLPAEISAVLIHPRVRLPIGMMDRREARLSERSKTRSRQDETVIRC
jgi:hypothetical protein